MNTQTKAEKEIGYAYASSLTAKRLGFYKTGCFYVSLIPRMAIGRVGGKGEEKLLQGFDTKAEAFAHADLLLPGVRFSRWTISRD
jgi:hypothetical protein